MSTCFKCSECEKDFIDEEPFKVKVMYNNKSTEILLCGFCWKGMGYNVQY